jgi:hypothetical protein
MFTAGEALRRYWLRHEINLNHGAPEDEIAAFEARYQVQLPKEMRDYFATVNGFGGSEHLMTDENVIAFLALGEIKTLSEAWSPKIEEAASYFVFADYSLSVHVYAVRLSSSSEDDNPVVVAYDDRNIARMASSFSEFVQQYLEENKAVLFPEAQV